MVFGHVGKWDNCLAKSTLLVSVRTIVTEVKLNIRTWHMRTATFRAEDFVELALASGWIKVLR